MPAPHPLHPPRAPTPTPPTPPHTTSNTSPAPPAPQEFPSLLHPLITERDQYMAFMLRRLASRAQAVVAVVGAGHLQGIRWGPPAQSAALPLSAGKGARLRWHLPGRCTSSAARAAAHGVLQVGDLTFALLRASLHDLCQCGSALPHCREHWDKDIDIAEITAMPAERQPPTRRWRRVALLAAGGVLVSTVLLRLRR